MAEPITEDEEGKRVVGPNGESIGTVEKVDQGVAHVEPDADASEAIRERLDWADQGDYTLQETEIEDVTDDEVVVRAE